MKVTILNGNASAENAGFDIYVEHLSQQLQAQGHTVSLMMLRQMKFSYCIGCFGCWVKKPGECVSADDSCQVCRAVIQSDFTLWAAPIRMGYPSALLKKMMDKSISLLHPYFAVDHGEAHHRARYEHYPRLGLLMEREADTDEQDLKIINDLCRRTALNMKSRLEFSLLTQQPVEEVARAITGPVRKLQVLEARATATTGTQIQPPNRLTIFNGSPRGRKGNTPILLEQFAQGFLSAGSGRTSEIFHLNRLKEAERFPQAFGEAECVLLGFPLYTDAMPGIVKAFIEQLEPFRGRAGNPPIGFLVQSGFPESAHSRYVERFLEKLAARLNSPYLGTIVKGGAEGVRLMPENMNHKLFETLQQLGKTFGETGRFNATLLRGLAKPERYPAYAAPLFQVFTHLPIANFYWDGMLKQNGVFERRFARPYEG